MLTHLMGSRQPRRKTADALCALLMLVPGCGTAETDRGFTPRGVVASPQTPQAAAPSTAAVRIDEATGPGPEFHIEWPEELDAKRKAMFQALTDDYIAQWRAIASRGKDLSYLKGIDKSVWQSASDWVHSFVKAKRSAKGVIKIYGFRVIAVVGRGAEVAACVDRTGLRLTDWQGKVVAEQPDWVTPPKSSYLHSVGLRFDEDGVWRVRLYRFADYPHEFAKECAR